MSPIDLQTLQQYTEIQKADGILMDNRIYRIHIASLKNQALQIPEARLVFVYGNGVHVYLCTAVLLRCFAGWCLLIRDIGQMFRMRNDAQINVGLYIATSSCCDTHEDASAEPQLKTLSVQAHGRVYCTAPNQTPPPPP